MEKYNKHDVLSLEELYEKLIPWDSSINFNLYSDSEETVCKCGSTEFQNNGHAYTAKGKFKRFRCKHCGAETRGTKDQFTKPKKDSLRVTIK